MPSQQYEFDIQKIGPEIWVRVNKGSFVDCVLIFSAQTGKPKQIDIPSNYESHNPQLIGKHIYEVIKSNPETKKKIIRLIDLLPPAAVEQDNIEAYIQKYIEPHAAYLHALQKSFKRTDLTNEPEEVAHDYIRNFSRRRSGY